MGVSGSWATKARVAYTGPQKLGTGYNPIHEIRDSGRGRVIGTKENLIPLGEPSDVVATGLTSAENDWLVDEYVDDQQEGEAYRYQDDRPRYDSTTPDFRGDTNSAAMGETPAWGVYFDVNPDGDFPRPGPTAGTQAWLDVARGEARERQHAIAVPTQPVTGGWLSKVRGAQAHAEAQDQNQPGFVWTINNSTFQGQGVQQLDNTRATGRGTDDYRSPIRSRTAGIVEKVYARSFGMGGGSGTPDMQPRQVTAGYRRPFLVRTAATPPAEAHFYGTMEGRVPISRTMPQDPYQGDPESSGLGTDEDNAADWGY